MHKRWHNILRRCFTSRRDGMKQTDYNSYNARRRIPSNTYIRTRSRSPKRTPTYRPSQRTHSGSRYTYANKRTRANSQYARVPNRSGYTPRSETQKRSGQGQTFDESTPHAKSLGALNLVGVLNSFYTIRSTVKDIRTSLERLDDAMDSAYQMFEIARGFVKSGAAERSRPQLQLVPPSNSKRGRSRPPTSSKRSPGSNQVNDAAPFAGIFDQVDIGQLMSMLQSPFIQGFVKQMFQQGLGGSRAK